MRPLRHLPNWESPQYAPNFRQRRDRHGGKSARACGPLELDKRYRRTACLGGGSKTKEISMNHGVKVLITNQRV